MHSGGLGEVLGDALVTQGPLYISAQVWWVHHSGNDSNDGRERLAPLATLAQAITNASNGDVIVCKDGHAETVTAAVSVSKRLIIVGAGRSDSKPTAKFTINAASESLFTVSAAGVELRNLWIEESAQANDDPRINVTASRFRMIGCYVECNGNDDDYALVLNVVSGDFEIRDTTFISTSTTVATAPQPAVSVEACSRLVMKGVVFDGGTVGFEDGVAYIEGGAITQLDCESLSLLRGADMAVNSGTVGYIQPAVSTGNPRIDWTEE